MEFAGGGNRTLEGASFCPLHIAGERKLWKKQYWDMLNSKADRPTIPHRAHRQRSKRGRLPRSPRFVYKEGVKVRRTTNCKCTQPVWLLQELQDSGFRMPIGSVTRQRCPVMCLSWWAMKLSRRPWDGGHVSSSTGFYRKLKFPEQFREGALNWTAAPKRHMDDELYVSEAEFEGYVRTGSSVTEQQQNLS